MVDRPIKKSDREAAQQANPTDNQSTNDQAKDDQPKTARSTPKPIKKSDRTDGGSKSSDSRSDSGDRGRGGKGKGKGRGRGKDDAPKAPMNPALMRGPKPTKKVEVEEVAAEEVAAEEVAAEEGITAEGTEETTVAAAEEPAPATPSDTDA